MIARSLCSELRISWSTGTSHPKSSFSPSPTADADRNRRSRHRPRPTPTRLLARSSPGLNRGLVVEGMAPISHGMHQRAYGRSRLLIVLDILAVFALGIILYTLVITGLLAHDWEGVTLRWPPGRPEQVRKVAEQVLPPPAGLEFVEVRFQASGIDPGERECLTYKPHIRTDDAMSYYRTALEAWQWGVVGRNGNLIVDPGFTIPPREPLWLRVIPHDISHNVPSEQLPPLIMVCSSSWDLVARLRPTT
jgi:hypothetical protein